MQRLNRDVQIVSSITKSLWTVVTFGPGATDVGDVEHVQDRLKPDRLYNSMLWWTFGDNALKGKGCVLQEPVLNITRLKVDADLVLKLHTCNRRHGGTPEGLTSTAGGLDSCRGKRNHVHILTLTVKALCTRRRTDDSRCSTRKDEWVMTPWQVLHAGRAAHAARGHHVHHEAAGSVQYSSGSAAGSAAADGCRSFCLSREKVALQKLNERLASCLQQVGRASTHRCAESSRVGIYQRRSVEAETGTCVYDFYFKTAYTKWKHFIKSIFLQRNNQNYSKKKVTYTVNLEETTLIMNNYHVVINIPNILK